MLAVLGMEYIIEELVEFLECYTLVLLFIVSIYRIRYQYFV